MEIDEKKKKKRQINSYKAARLIFRVDGRKGEYIKKPYCKKGKNTPKKTKKKNEEFMSVTYWFFFFFGGTLYQKEKS